MKMKGEPEDTGFVPRQILIWKCRVQNRHNQSDQICQSKLSSRTTDFARTTVCKMQCVCKMQGVGRTNTRLVLIFAAAFDWRILPPYQYTLA